MDIDTFTPYLRKQLVLAGLDATKLDRSIALSNKESDDFTNQMQKNSEKGFKLFHDYIKAEQAKTHELEKMLDNMKNPPKLLSDSAIPLAEYVSQSVDIGASTLEKYEKWQQDTQASMTQSLKNPVAPDRKLISIQSQLSRLMAVSGPLPATATPGTSAGYAPLYEGIFILSPITKTQTRLFDYTDGVSAEDEVNIVDIDKDGDNDYIYMLG